MQLPGEVEQPRVLLVSVPYALKAADAETLGGMPASAFLLAAPTGTASGAAGAATSGSGTSAAAQGATQKGTTPKQATTKRAGAASLPPPGPISGSGTPGQVAKFTTDNFTITDLRITDNGTNVGIGTTTRR